MLDIRQKVFAGQRYGKLVTIEIARRGRYGREWRCVCDCGNETIARAAKLTNGEASGCGCQCGRYEHKKKHGHSPANGQSPTYRSYRHMLGRCDPRHPRYDDWGGRGIAICERWRGPDGFVNFLADMGERPEGKTLDRVDNDGNYEPGNCRWATSSEQHANKRRRAR